MDKKDNSLEVKYKWLNTHEKCPRSFLMKIKTTQYYFWPITFPHVKIQMLIVSSTGK